MMKQKFLLATVVFVTALIAAAQQTGGESSTTTSGMPDSISAAEKADSNTGVSSSEPSVNSSMMKDSLPVSHGSGSIPSESVQSVTVPVDSTGADTLEATSVPKLDVRKEQPSSIIEESEEELILDGGEEAIIAPPAAETVPQEPLSGDSQKVLAPASADSSSGEIDSASGEQQKEPAFQYPASAMPKISDAPPQPMRIEAMQSINFAKNFKEYRSLKVAMFLSLLVPGAGQAYAHNLVKTGVFGAVEIGLIAAGAIVGFNGKRKWEYAHDYADKNFSVDSFAVYYKNLKSRIPDIDSQLFATYVSVDTFYLEAREKNQDYYNYISHEVSPYIHGWNDVRPRFDASFEIISDEHGVYVAHPDPDSSYLVYQIYENGDSSLAQYGFSEHQKEFNRRLSKSNSYYRWSKSLFTILVLNHIASAIDAGITAKAYNDKLLGKRSFWQKLNIRESYVSTPTGPANGLALEVRF
ncbi:MAG: hypothetical protein JXA18_07025 [Chitinispirillaceae bacterium]|nr:hypothetical protein [Chitinispirillaceae bacterium]